VCCYYCYPKLPQTPNLAISFENHVFNNLRQNFTSIKKKTACETYNESDYLKKIFKIQKIKRFAWLGRKRFPHI
jgi:hypothetical protein